MKVLYVAYPLNGVSAESCGGAEQMLHTIEAGFARRGHETVVAACAGSRVAGRLEATGNADPPLDSFEQRDAAHNARVLQILHQARLSGHPFDLVHDHGGSFWRLADGIREPVLLTAHHARHFYGDDLARAPQNAFVNCVSETQSASFDDVTSLVGTVRNGIVLARFPFEEEKSDYLLWLGRICHEKGAHVALDAGRRLGMRVVIAGDVYSFSYHQQYFEREVLPRINGADAELVIRPSLARKIELLARARAVLIPSMVDEASSLVAMEAAACGTPVIAFRRGALPEVVVEGKTGFVVDTPGGMALAVSRTPEISPDICRRHAQENFGADRMVTKYEALYWRVRRMCERRPVPAAA